MPLESFTDPQTLDQATSAGFASVEVYVQNLLERDRERLAVQEGIDAMQAGHHRPFDEFDKEFRKKNGLAPRR